MVALYVSGGRQRQDFYDDLFRRYGYEADAEAAKTQDLYLDGKKEEVTAVIPTDLFEAISIVGPESYVAALAEAGVTHHSGHPGAGRRRVPGRRCGQGARTPGLTVSVGGTAVRVWETYGRLVMVGRDYLEVR